MDSRDVPWLPRLPWLPCAKPHWIVKVMGLQPVATKAALTHMRPGSRFGHCITWKMSTKFAGSMFKHQYIQVTMQLHVILPFKVILCLCWPTQEAMSATSRRATDWSVLGVVQNETTTVASTRKVTSGNYGQHLWVVWFYIIFDAIRTSPSVHAKHLVTTCRCLSNLELRISESQLATARWVSGNNLSCASAEEFEQIRRFSAKVSIGNIPTLESDIMWNPSLYRYTVYILAYCIGCI